MLALEEAWGERKEYMMMRCAACLPGLEAENVPA